MKKDSKIDLSNYLPYSFPLAIVIIIIILAIFVCFLYKNVYQTIAEAQELTSLRQNVISEQLEKNKFTEIIANMEKKIMPANSTSSITTVTSTTDIPTSTTSTANTSAPKNKQTSSTKSTSTVKN
ncbi:MAG: hypothetical protein WC244_00565 [Patescibacteria group bacterium]|jgi:predicted PurR-regulated permease PerM